MRFTSLDALRGIAAVIVVIYHAVISLPETKWLVDTVGRNISEGIDSYGAVLSFLPTRILYMGDEAVILFFVLSGFVLSLPFQKENTVPFSGYALKRFCRIFLPATAAILLSFALLLLAGVVPTARPMGILDLLWRDQPSAAVLLQHVLLLSHAIPLTREVYPLDPPLWSLEVEWHCSLLLPFLVLLARKSGAAVLAVAAAGLLLAILEQRFLHHSLLVSLRFLPMFALGVLLCQKREAIIALIRGLPRHLRLFLWLLCFALLDILAFLPSSVSHGFLPLPVLQTSHRLMIGLGAALLIALILASDRAQRLLNHRALLWLGKISFSLYLLHLPLMLAASRLLADSIAPAWRIILAIGLSFPLAAAFHRWVEVPSIDTGRRLSRWVEARRASRTSPASQSSSA